VGETFFDVALTDAVVGALRSAAAQRKPDRPLSTLDILLALEATDTARSWTRFIIDDRPKDDPAPTSSDSWEGHSLTGDAALALSRAKRLGEDYELLPLPPGVLALALVWNPSSAAARAFVGTSHDELLSDIQDDVLGMRLEGLERSDVRHPQGLDDPPGLNELEVHKSLAEVTPLLSTWFLRILTVAAVIGIWFSITTHPSWTFKPVDDLNPPISRPVLATAIPNTVSVNTLLGLDLVRDHDGLPIGRIFDSTLPTAWDIRNGVIDEAWAGHWESTDSRTVVKVELVSTVVDYGKSGMETRFVSDCVPKGTEGSGRIVERSGYVLKTDKWASYCSIARFGQTQLLVSVSTHDPELIGGLSNGVSQLAETISNELPETTAQLRSRFEMKYGQAQIRRAWLSVILLIPIVLLLPTVLIDRAFWQRIRWSLFLRRFTSTSHPGWDIDPMVRGSLWSYALWASLQILAAVWVLRGLWAWEHWQDLVRVFADRIGWVLAGSMDLALALAAALFVGMLSRILRRHRKPGPRAFRGSPGLLWVIGVILSLATLVLAYGVINLGTATSSLGTGSGSDFEQQRFSSAFRLSSVAVILFALIPMSLMRRLSMRALRTRELQDSRPPILLLRSFADDNIKVRARGNHRRSLIDRLSLRRRERFEEVVAAALAVQGPVEAVGQVGERLPPALGVLG
jgi:hypothetical protein